MVCDARQKETHAFSNSRLGLPVDLRPALRDLELDRANSRRAWRSKSNRRKESHLVLQSPLCGEHVCGDHALSDLPEAVDVAEPASALEGGLDQPGRARAADELVLGIIVGLLGGRTKHLDVSLKPALSPDEAAAVLEAECRIGFKGV